MFKRILLSSTAFWPAHVAMVAPITMIKSAAFKAIKRWEMDKAMLNIVSYKGALLSREQHELLLKNKMEFMNGSTKR